MIKAFKTSLGLDAVSDNVCLFVDGLDEYDGDYDVMTEMVLHMVSSSNRQKLRLELCLSSRPLPVFKDAFKPCPKIRLEDRTFQDINSSVEGTLGKTEGMQQSIKQDLDTADQLFRDVASEASGVFLRVRLVVLSNPFGRVPENPIDFQTSGEDWKNYLPISRAFTGVCWEQASRLFQMVHCAPEPLGTVALAFADHGRSEALHSPTQKMTTMDRVLIWSRNGRSLEGSVCRSARNNNVKTRTIKHTASPPKYQEMIVKFESDYGRVSDSEAFTVGVL